MPYRVGVVAPAGNTMVEREFNQLAHPELAVRGAAFWYPSDPATFCADLPGCLEPALTELGAWGADVVFLGCTTATMQCSGPEFEAGLVEMTGVPVVTAAAACLGAMNVLGLGRVALATPYGDVSNHIISDFLTGQGLTVPAVTGLALDRAPEVWQREAVPMPPADVLALALSVDLSGADGLYLPCTVLPSLEAVAGFEATTGKPALSSTQAGCWAVLGQLGLHSPGGDFGRLLGPEP